MADVDVMFAVSTFELSLRMGVALTVVLTVLSVATAVGKKRLRSRGGDRAPIVIRHQQQLSKHTTVALVTAGQRNLLIAINPQATTLLAEGADLTASPTAAADPAANPAATPAARAPQIDIRSLQNPLKQLQNKTVRRA